MLLLFLCVLLVFMGSLSIVFIASTFFLKVISLITGGLSSLAVSSNFKLSILAVGVILFALSIYCNKIRDWAQKKVAQIGDRIQKERVSQENSHTSTASATNLSMSLTVDSKV